MNETPSLQSDSPSLSARQKLRAWLELARISNLPTVWSNVLVGVSIATVADSGELQFFDANASPRGIALNLGAMLRYSVVPMFAISLFYIAGMMLNDLLDYEIDKKDRPSRPLPSGRISKKAANNTVCFLLIIGLFSLWVWSMNVAIDGIGVSIWGALGPVALIASIIGYNYWHKRHPSSVLLMGVSRSLVYVTTACTLYWPIDNWHPAWLMAIVLGLYTIGITVIARGETKDSIDSRKWLAPLMLFVVLAMLVVVQPWWFEQTHDISELIWVGVAGLALCVWLVPTFSYVFIKPPKTVKAILTWLSGMCLVDAYFLTLLGQPILAAIAGCCFLLTAWGHRHILGT